MLKPVFQMTSSKRIDQVQFQPQRSQKLISGSTDGLVNLYDLTQKDEDEALIQVANHGSSINHAGFLSASQFFALSHDEKFSIYHVDDQENLTDDLPPTAFGDLRPRINCEYVVDVIPSGAGEAIIGAGSHSKQELDLVALRLTEGSWELDPYNTIRLPGAHGEEIVRSMYFDHSAHTIFTAGEDGKIKAWRTTGAVDNSETQVEDAEVEWPREKKKKRNSTDKGDGKGRFKPY